MPHITLADGVPGILGPMLFRPETAKPLNKLAEILLRGPNSLSRAERELIATYVSTQNDCFFCQSIHGAVAAHHLQGDEDTVFKTKHDPQTAAISNKLKALLVIAGKVQKGGKNVTSEDVEAARKQGVTDLEIHDTVLIAAMFCMCNRYVDGLATWAPQDPEMYRQHAAELATHGYAGSTERLPAASAAGTA
ncbi:MAG: carboxymuconolactone decarboxylase family protein [Bryobacteraceae bacterium]